MQQHKSHLKVYKAFVVECLQCGQQTTYWSKSVELPITHVIQRAENEGWLAYPQGSYCPECSKTDSAG